MKCIWHSLAALAVLACGGCGSAPVRYHSLTPALPATTAAPAAVCCTVDLKNVRIPVEVDRRELVTRRNDEQLDILDNDLWLAPLRDEIRGALLDRIRRELAESATSAGSAASQRFVVGIDVERFESVLAQHALIQARWKVEASDLSGVAAPICEATVSIAVTGGIDALVLGHQKAIAGIADQIEASIVEIRRTGTVSCNGQPS